MGGGGSRPAIRQAPSPPPRVAPPTAPVQQRVIEDPRPGEGNNTTGVSVSSAKGCQPCRLAINPNISTSVVTLTRSSESASGSKCRTDEVSDPAKPPPVKYSAASPYGGLEKCKKTSTGRYRYVVSGDDSVKGCPPEYQTISEKSDGGVLVGTCRLNCPPGTYASQESNYTRCWQQGGRSPSADQGSLRDEFDFQWTPRVPGGKRSANKMFITPDKAFELTLDGKKITVTKMALYRPSPIRVENIQADAVLSLNDYSDPAATTVILLPISAAVTYGSPGDFVGRIAENINAFAVNESTGQYMPLNVPVGNDWSLTRVLEVADKTSALVAGGFFKWESAEYERFTRINTPTLIHYGWRRKGTGVTTILMKDPIAVSYVTSTYLSMLPYAPSSESAPPPAENYVYKAPICTACKGPPKFDPAKIEDLKGSMKPIISPLDIVKWVGAALATMVVLAAIYFALDFALKGNGQFLRGASVSISEFLVMPRKRPTAPPA